MKKSSRGIGVTLVSPLDNHKRTPDDSPQAVATARDNEISQRVADFEAGRTQGVPLQQVRAKKRALIASHKAQVER